jgi:four helix bundle protein
MVEVVNISNSFPAHQKYELVAQIRAAARSVCSCIAEAWRKRNYPVAFASKLTEAESEAAETQTWIDVALAHKYVEAVAAAQLIQTYTTPSSAQLHLHHAFNGQDTPQRIFPMLRNAARVKGRVVELMVFLDAHGVE